MLARTDFSPEVIEREPVWRPAGTGMYLPGNATRALRALGLQAQVASRAVEIPRQRFYDHRGRLLRDGKDPIAAVVNLVELRAVISSFGFRRSMRVRPDELRRLTVPTLVIWGDNDPVGSVNVAQQTATLIPNAQLEVLPAGHVPHLGNPDRVSELLSSFVRSGSDE
jgi:pimeloyl-ACP methyl ester carboxylesterase